MDTVKEELPPVCTVTVFVSPCRRNCLRWFLLISALLCMLSRGYNLAVIRQNILSVPWTSSSRCLSIRDISWIHQFRLVNKLASVVIFVRGLHYLSLMLLLLSRVFSFLFLLTRRSSARRLFKCYACIIHGRSRRALGNELIVRRNRSKFLGMLVINKQGEYHIMCPQFMAASCSLSFNGEGKIHSRIAIIWILTACTNFAEQNRVHGFTEQNQASGIKARKH